MPKRKSDHPPPRKPFDPIPLLAGAAIVFLVLAVYRPAADAAFIWDDDDYVQKKRGLVEIWFDREKTPQYYPLVFTSFWIERQLWEDSPRGYHEINIILHGACAVLLWRILKYLAVPGAYLAALIFAVHPVMVESVAWITERKNTLSLLFYLLAARFYLRFAFAPAIANLKSQITNRHYILALLFFVCALLSKSVTATFPAAMLLILVWKNKRITARDLTLLAPFFILGVAAGLHTSYLERTQVGAAGREFDIPFVHRLLIAGRAPWFYASKLLLPINLSFIYRRWEINPAAWWQWLYPAALLAVLAALFFLRKRIGVAPLVAVLFFLGTLFPALGFFNVYPMRYSFVADHFAYHASTGLIALAAALLAKLWLRPGFQKFAPVIAVPMIFGLSFATMYRAGLFENNGTLFADVVHEDKNPGSWVAWQNLANYTLTTRPTHAEARKQALEWMQGAWNLEPNIADTNFHLGNMLVKHNPAEAEKLFNRAVLLDPRHANAWIALAGSRIAQNKIESAEFALRKAFEIAPDHPDAHFELAMIHQQAKRTDQALEHLKKALAANPYHEQALREAANIYIARNQFKEAADLLGRLVSRMPDNPDHLFDYGAALIKSGEEEAGNTMIRRAIQMKPQLGSRLPTRPNP